MQDRYGTQHRCLGVDRGLLRFGLPPNPGRGSALLLCFVGSSMKSSPGPGLPGHGSVAETMGGMMVVDDEGDDDDHDENFRNFGQRYILGRALMAETGNGSLLTYFGSGAVPERKIKQLVR